MTQEPTFQLDKNKFHELVIHTANLMKNDPTASIIRINKVLYYSDFAAYREFEKPITGASYRKYHEGPAPDYMERCLTNLAETNRALVAVRHHVLGYFKYLRTIPGAPPADLSLFTKDELAMVLQATNYFQGKTPTEIIAMATTDPAWVDSHFYDHIPYEAVWSSVATIADQLADIQSIKFAAEHPVLETSW